MANFSLAKADNLRKAISKKQVEQLKIMEKDFIAGAIQKGYSKEIAQKVYDQIMKFANYGFNRSHSVAYGLLAYQLAYLKANYPKQFFCSLLNGVISSETKTSEYIFQAKKRNIEIVKPSINDSYAQYVLQNGRIYFPLLAIKQIGTMVCSAILQERQTRGKFKDFFDFVARALTKKINKKTMETLIYAGALDEFGINRFTLIQTLEDAIRYGELVKIEEEQQIVINFDLVSRPSYHVAASNPMLQARMEKEVLGLYLSKHPIEEVRKEVNPNLLPILLLHSKFGSITCLGYIEKTKEHRTKNGDLMLFATISDESGTMDLVIFPKIFQKYQLFLQKGNYILVNGNKKEENTCVVNYVEQIKKVDKKIS